MFLKESFEKKFIEKYKRIFGDLNVQDISQEK